MLPIPQCYKKRVPEYTRLVLRIQLDLFDELFPAMLIILEKLKYFHRNKSYCPYLVMTFL